MSNEQYKEIFGLEGKEEEKIQDSLAVEKKKRELWTAMETPNLFEPETILKWGRKKMKSRKKKFKEEFKQELELEDEKIILEELKEMGNDDTIYDITFDHRPS